MTTNIISRDEMNNIARLAVDMLHADPETGDHVKRIIETVVNSDALYDSRDFHFLRGANRKVARLAAEVIELTTNEEAKAVAREILKIVTQ